MADSGLNRVVQHLFRAARGRGGGDLSDGELLECFLAGREELAFEALVHRHGPMVLGVCRRVLGHAQDAEDAFQATFLVLMRKGTSIRPRAKVVNWLYGVAHRIALKARAVRLKRQAKEKPMDAGQEPATTAPEPGPDWLPLLDRELHGLPAKYRVPIILCDLQGKTQHDAARQLGWREGTLSGRLCRARQLLGRRLTRRGFTLSVPGLAAALSAQGASAKVPAALAAKTVKAASFVAIKQAVTAGVISAQAAALIEGVLTTMLWTKLKAAFICIVALAVVTTGIGRALYTASGQSKAPGASRSGGTEVVGKAEAPSRKVKELEAKLQAFGKFEYLNKPLSDVLDDLRTTRGINIVVDQQAFDIPLGEALREVKVSLQLYDVPVETALRYLLKSVKLGFVNQDGVLVVTSRDKAMIRKAYPVGALLGKDEEKNALALIQVITRTIEPESWSPQSVNVFNQNVFNPFGAMPTPPGVGGAGLGGAGIGGAGLGGAGRAPGFGGMGMIGGEGGGSGSIAYFPGTKTLVVRQFFEVHREIEELLANLAEK